MVRDMLEEKYEWCRGCVFEYRFKACGHDVENCKKVMGELEDCFGEKKGV